MRDFDVFIDGTFLGTFSGYSEMSAIREMCFQKGLAFDPELAANEYDAVEVIF